MTALDGGAYSRHLDHVRLPNGERQIACGIHRDAGRLRAGDHSAQHLWRRYFEIENRHKVIVDQLRLVRWVRTLTTADQRERFIGRERHRCRRAQHGGCRQIHLREQSWR